jgi:hypothetical protein
MFVDQQDGTAERVEGFGHPLAHDGPNIEHIANRHRTPNMRQQQLCQHDLALGEDSLAHVPAEIEAGQMQWRVHQE